MRVTVSHLIALSFLMVMTGCTPQIKMHGSSANGLYGNSEAAGYIYPSTSNKLMNDMIAMHKADYNKDFKKMFTMPAPQTTNTCGITLDDLKEMAGDTKQMQKEMKKASREVNRATGMDMTMKISFSDYEFLDIKCPTNGAKGAITFRYRTTTFSSMPENNYESESIVQIVKSADLDNNKKPSGITRILTKTESMKTRMNGKPLDLPRAEAIALAYATADNKLSASFINTSINGGSGYMTMLTETLGEGRSKMDSWSNDLLTSTSYMKNGKPHGPSIVYAQKMSISGVGALMGPIDMPEQRRCFKEGEEIKTSGECRWDD